MKRSKFSESQIFAILKEAESGQKVGDVCRNHGISTATFYSWRSKYGGMDVSMLKQYKELEVKYNRLQKMFTDSQLDNQILKEVIEGVV